MIISREQVRLAVEYLRKESPCEAPPAVSLPVPEELFERVLGALELAPDVRADRIEQARAMLREGDLSGAEVADKIIGRIISDSIR